MLSVRADQQRMDQTLPYLWPGKTFSGVALPRDRSTVTRRSPFASIPEEILMEDPGVHQLLADRAFVEMDLTNLP